MRGRFVTLPTDEQEFDALLDQLPSEFEDLIESADTEREVEN